ncbi:uncharacterized protein LOC110373535 [Helicoverpa armigera]|uniref:uncharacterized protein LOC110373535 n=1 Tax=Helicoverpa armigera TaxID=29058 RepID=UPI003082C83F
MQEKQSCAPIIPFERVNERVAAATGISLRTVARIGNEGRLAEASSSKIVTPGKNRKTRKDKILMDNFDIGVLRRKIHEFYTFKKEIPTVNKLLQVLREEIGFTGSREILRQHIKMIGFRFRKTISNRKVLMERNDITAWRARYLQTLKHNDDTEKLPVVYLDETYIHSGHTAGKCWQNDDEDGVLEPISKGQRFIIVHAGGNQGFMENACLVFKSQTKSGDYHDDMNHTNFKKWVLEKLSPNLKEPSLIVMDNAPYHNTSVNKPPNTSSRKDEIIEWLRINNIEYSEEYTRPQLLELVNRNKPEPVYAVDAILKGLGHKICRLPPYHCDLNPIEMIWASMKRKVAEINRSSNNIVVRIYAFDTISVEEWRNHCGHVKKLEEEYRKKDGYLDEPFIIRLCSDSEESTDDDDSQDEDDEEFNRMQPLDVVLAEHNYSKRI